MDKCKYVDVFLGSGPIDLPVPHGVAKTWHFIKGLCGNTHPGAVLPFGKLSACAYSGGYSAGYGNIRVNCGEPLRLLHGGDRVKGFSHIHQSGTGFINTFYNYAVVTPFYGDISASRELNHMENERACPGWYAVDMRENGISCELTVSEKAAVHHYRFPKKGGRIAIDFSNDGLYHDEHAYSFDYPSEGTMEVDDKGGVAARVVLKGLPLYMYARLDCGAGDARLTSDDREIEGKTFTYAGDKKPFGCVFDLPDDTHAILRLGISPLSAEKAKEDVLSEVRDFNEIREAAYEAWNEALGRIEIETDDERMKRIFYSNLYHTLVKPSDWSGESFLYDHEEAFTLDLATLWDQYKTQMPLLFTLYPEISDKIVRTIIAFGQKFGHLPHTLSLDGDDHACDSVQARALASHVLTDAYLRGVPMDLVAAVEEIARDVFESGVHEDFFTTGSCEYLAQIVDLTDGCKAAAMMARAACRSDLAEKFEEVAKAWPVSYDPATGILRSDSKFYEGSHWNYSFRLMHDMPARIALAGGKEKFEALLDKFFGFADPEDVSARFEGFNNETDMEMPYAYHYVGAQEKLTEVLDGGVKYMFTEGRGGIPGNNDSGGLSSLYIWNTLGIFPVSGQDLMLIGAPQFDRAVMHLANDRDLTIVREGAGVLVKRAVLNGKVLENFEFAASEMMNGGTLVLETE